MGYSGTVCIFSEDEDILNSRFQPLASGDYQVFATSNAYNFVRYARELHPDVLIVDVDASAMQNEQTMRYLRHHRSLTNRPIVLLGRDIGACYRGIAHYEQKPLSDEKMDEIISSYCGGSQDHDVLLIDECETKDNGIKDAIEKQDLSCFEVNDGDAARYYLLKNNPKCICLNMPYDKCRKLEPKLKHDKIFFVENSRNVQNLARLI